MNPTVPGTVERVGGNGTRSNRAWLLAFIFLALAAAPRIVLATRPGLWVDEIFSLAMATGHSLEQPAATARPELGDFVEPRAAVPPSTFDGYTQHDERSMGEARRVVRAVFLSDTSPPLYYLLLSRWTRWFGTSDSALRLFSTFCAMLCFPFLWLIARQVAGPSAGPAAGWIACALFAVSPPALYYAAEGRMYALVWLFGLILIWAALALHERGPGPRVLATWIATGAAGLLTHYFFVFVWTAAVVWLWFNTGKVRRVHLIAAVVIIGVLVLPWYIRLPASLHQWRVTEGWLNHRLSPRQMVTAPIALVWGMLSGGDALWGTSSVRALLLASLLYSLLAVATVRRGLSGHVSPRWGLLWLWLVASVAGPLVFDLLRGTNASLIARYALPGLPAAILIVAVAASLLPQGARVTFVALLALAWSPRIRDIFSEPPRPWEQFLAIDGELAQWARLAPARNSDVVIVQSIPSGVIGVARYLRVPLPLTSWVVQLGQRGGADDMQALTAGRCRVAYVAVHTLELQSPVQGWLQQNAILEKSHRTNSNVQVEYYAMRGCLRCPECSRSGSAPASPAA